MGTWLENAELQVKASATPEPKHFTTLLSASQFTEVLSAADSWRAGISALPTTFHNIQLVL